MSCIYGLPLRFRALPRQAEANLLVCVHRCQLSQRRRLCGKRRSSLLRQQVQEKLQDLSKDPTPQVEEEELDSSGKHPAAPSVGTTLQRAATVGQLDLSDRLARNFGWISQLCALLALACVAGALIPISFGNASLLAQGNLAAVAEEAWQVSFLA